MKALYFEGAGCFDHYIHETHHVSYGDLGNCRIRTAFKVGDKAYYIEVLGTQRDKYNAKSVLYQWPVTGFFDMFAPIDLETGEIDYVNSFNKAVRNPDSKKKYTPRSFEYCKKELLRLVNDMTGAKFDSVEVADEYSGFRVFGDRVNHVQQYNFGDEFIPNHDYERMHRDAYNAIYEKTKNAHKEKFPCVIFYISETASPYFMYRKVNVPQKECKAYDVREFNIDNIEV